MTLLRRLRVLRQRLRSSWRKEAMDAELLKEFAFHLDQLVHENIAEGMPSGEARSAARRTLGNAGLLEEECRDQRRVTWLHDLWQDLCYGARMLRKNPGFSIIATSSLALGIGGNTAILGVMGSVLLGDLSLPHADRLVVIRTFPLENPQQSSNASVPDYLAWKEQSRSFEVMGASLSDQKDFGLEEDGTPAERVTGQGFSPSLFATLGVQPVLGRVFSDVVRPEILRDRGF